MQRYDYEQIEFSALPADVLVAFDYWRSLKADRLAPSWPEFDLMKLPAHLIPYTNVVDVVDGGKDFFCRFYGSSLAEIHGKELSSKLVSTAEPEELREAVLISMREIIEIRRPMARVAQIYPRHVVTLQSLIRMPLSDDGKEITNIVTVAQYQRGVRDSKEIVATTFTSKSG